MTRTIVFSHISLEDKATIARGLKAKDPEVLDALIERHQHRVLHYLIYLTGNRHEAEDLFQELWLRVMRSGSSYNGSASFEGWLAAIARNLVIDLRRRRQLASLDALQSSEDGDFSFDIAEDGPNVFDRVRGREELARLNRALETLDVHQRQVLKLRFNEGLALREIAREMRTPLCTVKSRLYRGVAALRCHFSQR